MKTKRTNTFETNSSSVHTLTIASAEDFEKFENCDMLLNYETLVPAEDVYKEMMETLAEAEDKMTEDYRKTYKDSLTFEKFKEVLKGLSDTDLSWHNRDKAYGNINDDYSAVIGGMREDVTTLDCLGNEYYETYVERYKTKSGDEIVAFGYFGRDG